MLLIFNQCIIVTALLCLLLPISDGVFKQGYDKTTAKKHLLVFALAAPLSAFLSYFGLVRVSVSELSVATIISVCV